MEATLAVSNSGSSEKEKVVLSRFLTAWDAQNHAEHRKVALFDPAQSRRLSMEQKQYLARVFYHVRGHFVDFLWFLGNHAPGLAAKKSVMDNIAEELGGNLFSHEQLYEHFAESFGVDLTSEIVFEETYLPWVRDYNQAHLAWLARQDWEGKLAGFAAYERLDNVDYADLLVMAKSFNLPPKALVFFEVHAKVQHYEMLSRPLMDAWLHDPQKVREAFTFIADHQNAMWKRLSEEIFRDSYSETQEPMS